MKKDAREWNLWALLSMTLVYILFLPIGHAYLGDMFIVRSWWYKEAIYLSACYVVLLALCFHLTDKWTEKHGPLEDQIRLIILRQNRLRRIFAGIILYPVFGGIFFLIACEVLPALHANFFGQSYKSEIAIMDKEDFHKGRKVCVDGYVVKSPQLKEASFINYLCMTEKDYKILPQRTALKVSGKKTSLGWTIEDYEMVQEEKSLEYLEGIAAQWE